MLGRTTGLLRRFLVRFGCKYVSSTTVLQNDLCFYIYGRVKQKQVDLNDTNESIEWLRNQSERKSVRQLKKISINNTTNIKRKEMIETKVKGKNSHVVSRSSAGSLNLGLLFCSAEDTYNFRSLPYKTIFSRTLNTIINIFDGYGKNELEFPCP